MGGSESQTYPEVLFHPRGLDENPRDESPRCSVSSLPSWYGQALLHPPPWAANPATASAADMWFLRTANQRIKVSE